MVKSHFLGNEGSDKIKKSKLFNIVYFISALKLALGAIRDRLRFIKPYCKRDVMV